MEYSKKRSFISFCLISPVIKKWNSY